MILTKLPTQTLSGLILTNQESWANPQYNISLVVRMILPFRQALSVERNLKSPQ